MVKYQQNFIQCEKNELVIFKHQRKKVDSPIKIKLNCRRLYLSYSIKYLDIEINEHFNWKQHIHDIAIKPNRANALLSIISCRYIFDLKPYNLISQERFGPI